MLLASNKWLWPNLSCSRTSTRAISSTPVKRSCSAAALNGGGSNWSLMPPARHRRPDSKAGLSFKHHGDRRRMVRQADPRFHRRHRGADPVRVSCRHPAPAETRSCALVAGVVPVLVMVSSGIMCVRGYVLDEQSLRVKRLLWDTPIALSRINSAEYNPSVAADLTRTWGNGGGLRLRRRFPQRFPRQLQSLRYQLGRYGGAAFERGNRGAEPI